MSARRIPDSPPGRTTVGYQVRPGGGRPGCVVCGQPTSQHKRCGAYVDGLRGGDGWRMSCCRPDGHDGTHCGHERVTGTPGMLTLRGPVCDGTHGTPFTTELLSPTERYYRDRRPVRPRTPPTGRDTS